MKTINFQKSAIAAFLIFSVFSALLAAIAFGVDHRVVSIQGPYEYEDVENPTEALIIDLRSHFSFSGLFVTGGDYRSSPSGSTLRLFVNGEEMHSAHSLHAEIRNEGGGRFSHWENHLIFSLPDGVLNSSEAQIDIYFPVYVNPKVAVVALFLVVGGVVVFLRYQFSSKVALRNSYVSLARESIFSFLSVIMAACLVFFSVYLVTIIIAWLSGYLLPNVAFFGWFPFLDFLSHFEPFWGHAIILFALFGYFSSWLAVFSENGQGDQREAEAYLTKVYLRYGSIFVVGLFLFSVGSTWSGVPRQQDLGGSALVGLVPFNDANGHFQQVYMQAMNGYWDSFLARRPLAASFRTIGVSLVGFNNYYFLMLQTVMLALATYFASRSIANWRGVWAALTFLGLTTILVRPYLPTNLTEPLGLFWALVSVPFIVRALRSDNLADIAVGIHATFLALMIRMGAMFTLPSLAAWAICTRLRRKWAIVGVFSLILAVFIFNLSLISGLSRLYGTPDGAVGSNFSHTICGLTHGGNWTLCGEIYAAELGGLDAESEQAELFYSKAAEKFFSEPSILFLRLLDGGIYFLSDIWDRSLTGYSGTIPNWFPSTLWWCLVIVGIARTLGKAREKYEISFWVFFVTGLVFSAPFVIFDDGWRVLCVSFVVLSLFFSIAFSSPVGVQSEVHFISPTKRYQPLSVFVFVAVFCLVAPALVYNQDLLDIRHLPEIELEVDEEVFLGSSRMSGVLVLPDDQELPTNVPAIHERNFISIVRYSGIEQYESLVTPIPLYEPPFAIVSAISVNRRTYGLLILPAEVFSQIDDEPWLMRYNEESGPLWTEILQARRLAD